MPRWGNDRGNRGQGVVVLLCDAGIGAQDDVGFAVVDGLEVKTVGVVEQHGLLGPEFLVCLAHTHVHVPFSSSAP